MISEWVLRAIRENRREFLGQAVFPGGSASSDPGFAFGGEGVELFGAAMFDEAFLDPGGQLLLARGARMALGNRAERAHEQRAEFEGVGGF
jgi:hypothetical protein